MDVDIKRAAKAHGITIISLSERLCVSRQTVHYYCEQGDKNPLAQLERIAEAIGCDVSEFFEQDKSKEGDFVAFVRRNGETRTFDTEGDLIEYVDTLKTR